MVSGIANEHTSENTASQGEKSKAVWTRNKIRTILVDVLVKMQEMGGNNLPEFTDRLFIMQEMERFDSLVAVDAITELSVRLEEYLPDDLFYDPVTLRPLTLGQTVERIYEILKDNALAASSHSITQGKASEA